MRNFYFFTKTTKEHYNLEASFSLLFQKSVFLKMSLFTVIPTPHVFKNISDNWTFNLFHIAFNYFVLCISCIDEFEILKKRPPSTPCCTHSAKCDRRTGHALKLNMEKFRTHLRSEGFEPVVESDRLHIWRKSETGKANYTYKGS